MIPIQAKLIAALGLALAFMGIVGIAHHKGVATGRADVQADWDRAKLGVAEATNQKVLAAVAANEAQHANNIKIDHGVTNDYQNDLAASGAGVTTARAHAGNERLRVDRAAVCSGAAPAGTPASPIVPNGAGTPALVDIPRTLETGLYDLAADDDREIGRLQAKVNALQEWAIAHGFSAR